jgi:Tol biopolymer transport system component
VIYRSTSSLDSPSFTADGKSVCFREDGRLQLLSLTPGAEARLIGEENAESCVTALTSGASPWRVSHEIKGGRAQVFRRAHGNAKPQQLTRDRFSNWMPRLSPAGTSIAFISGTEPPANGKPGAGDYLLRESNLSGADRGPNDSSAPRELARLYGGPGSLGPAPWSPDGKQLVFVSREPE